MKYMKSLFVVFLVSILACSLASADESPKKEFGGGNVTITIEVNDVDLDTAVTKNLKKTDELDVLVTLKIEDKNTTTEDVQIEVELTGYDKSDKGKVTDETDTFDVKVNQVYDKRLNLELPVRFEQGRYSLKVRIDDKTDSITFIFPVDIDAEGHLLEIRDIVLSPENEVKAGRALLVTARIKNRGAKEEEDVKVKASVPALGISASDYIDELDEEDCDKTADKDCDDSVTSEELYLRIPDCAEPGQYTVKVTVEYDDGDEEVTETTKINVVESDTCVASISELAITGKTIITIGPETQDISKGGSAMYPVTVANQGTESKVYSISVDSADWADFSVTPSNVLVVGASESKAAYISVAPKEGAAGLQVFSVTIKSGETVLKQVPLRANILGTATAGLGVGKIKKALEVGLVILVVLLVILGLIIGFNKLKGSEEEEETGEDKTYY